MVETKKERMNEGRNEMNETNEMNESTEVNELK